MQLKERIEAFVKLGELIQNLPETTFEKLANRVENANNWFTPEQTKAAFQGLVVMLQPEKLRSWLSNYLIGEVADPKQVGVLMAGNVPAVGFHDFMTVLLSGHKVAAKPSSSDSVLMKWLSEQLIQIEPRFGPYILLEEMLKGKDAYIATGSDNSARYFDYYFGKYPSIIRKNRTSVALFSGTESEKDYLALATDIFRYYGMGCRNVSKIYLKEREQLTLFLDAIEVFSEMVNHHKYKNNYDYNKSIYLVNQVEHLDNGFLLLKESETLVSPISVLYYEIYTDQEDLKEKIYQNEGKIQCIVSKSAWFPGSIPFGKTQMPEVDDYADQVDTMRFLIGL